MSLKDKVLGCLAASQIGSAMGAAVEGWDWRRIEKEHGVLDRFLSYEHYNNGWQREPGTTEDGMERQRVFLRAVRRAGGRITAADVARVWAEEVDLHHARWCMEPFDRRLIELAKAGAPPTQLGQFSPYTNLVSLARSCHPLGLINALDPAQAWEDVHQVGLALQSPTGSGLDWAGVVACAIAEACRPDASFDSMLKAALEEADEGMCAEVERAVQVAEQAGEPLDMRKTFEQYYAGHGIRYAASHANEVVCKAFAVVRATEGSPASAIVTGVNFGRDTDCLAAVAGGIAGALAGRADLREDWLKQLDAATDANPHTCLQATIDEMAEVVTDGLRAEMQNARERADALAGAME